MFNKKEEAPTVGKQVSKQAGSNNTTLIASGTRVTGDVSFSGHLEIEGEVVGNVAAPSDDQAMVRVLQSGHIKGEISAPRVVINGKVEGNVYSSAHIELAANAEVEGDVHYDTMEMARGAHINGNLLYEAGASSHVKLVADSAGGDPQ
jgi:cytoskeletal protein CcmA (bactofilin family)